MPNYDLIDRITARLYWALDNGSRAQRRAAGRAMLKTNWMDHILSHKGG